jgi:hypothetical protein
MIKIVSGWSNPGGSTTAFINLCNLFNENGYDCTFYGPHSWHLDKCKSDNIQNIKLTSEDIIIYHFLDVFKIRPPVKKFVLSLHEKDLYRLSTKPVEIFDTIHFLNEEQVEWHDPQDELQDLFICPNAHDFLNPSTKKKERAAAIIGNVDENKQVHTSVRRALEDGHKYIYLYGNNHDPVYWDKFVQPLIDTKLVTHKGFTTDKQSMYDSVTDVYHSSLSENASLVRDECIMTNVKFHGNENNVDQVIWTNEEVMNEWIEVLEL